MAGLMGWCRRPDVYMSKVLWQSKSSYAVSESVEGLLQVLPLVVVLGDQGLVVQGLGFEVLFGFGLSSCRNEGPGRHMVQSIDG